MTALIVPFGVAPQILGLRQEVQETLNECWAQWSARLPRNLVRQSYFDAKAKLKDLEVALPPQLLDRLDVVFGWPEKAVYEIANRIVLDGVAAADDAPDPFGLSPMLTENRFWTEFPQATVSAVSQSVAFVSVTRGWYVGQPGVVVQFHSALSATGLWDAQRRQIRAGFVITGVDPLNRPNRFMLMLPTMTVHGYNDGAGWVHEIEANRTGRVAFRALPYRPSLDRRFGRSKIDRVTMSLTDRGVRAAARLEVHSELFATLKLMLMGAGANTFTDAEGELIPLWSFAMSRINGIPKDEEGDVPTLETISAQSPEPHIAGLREIAAEFSGHSGVPLSNLGVSAANPESAQSKTIAREDTVNDAERQQRIFGEELLSVFEDMVMLREGLREPPEDMASLSLLWRRPDRPTMAALADAGAKQVGAIEGLAETEIGMELLGLSRSQIMRAQSQLRRAQSGSLVDRLLATKPGGGEPGLEVSEDN